MKGDDPAGSGAERAPTGGGCRDRKDDHIRIVEEEDAETGGSGFQDVQLIHEALPEIDYADIDASVEFLDQRST